MYNLHFKYVDTIRRQDGTLRPWLEHLQLTQIESELDGTSLNCTQSELRELEFIKHTIIDKEQNEKRS